MARLIDLRNYQLHYKSETNTFFEGENNRSLMGVMPTGTGKTTFFSSLTLDYVNAYKRVLLLVHRIELVDQIVARLLDFGITAGVVAGDYPLNLALPVQVGMIQSLNNFPYQSWIPDYIIIDECHHSPAGSYTRMWEYFPKAKILGVTATPVRTDKKGFDELYDRMLNLYPMSWFFDRGYLVRPKHFICTNFVPTQEVPLHGQEYDLVAMAKQCRDEKKIADIVRSYQVYSAGRRAVVFAVNVEHSKEIASRFNKAGIAAAHMDGELPKEVRRDITKQFSTGELKVLTNYDIVAEGYDVPAIESVILARRSKSLSWYMQAVGRCLRPAPGKEFGYVLDCANAWLEFGPAGMDYDWSLEGGDVAESMHRSRYFVKREDRVLPVVDNPEELVGVDLVEMGERLKRLAEFEYYYNEQLKGGRDFQLAVEHYHAKLCFRGIQMTKYEMTYCQSMLREVGCYLDPSFWSQLIPEMV